MKNVFVITDTPIQSTMIVTTHAVNLCSGGAGPPVDMREYSMFSLGQIQRKVSTFEVKLNTCFLSNTRGCGATNCVGVVQVHDQASSPLHFLMASAPPAEDGAELDRVVFVRLKGWFYEV